MGKYLVNFSESAVKELAKHKKAGNKAINNKIDKIFNELKETPFIGEGHPEPLKYSLTGLWSRRINKEHRMVYCVDENSVTVYVASAMGHYNIK
ncbi:Txe/YoeB family addiction module toxin [Flavobacterium sp. LB3P45]|uniref:Putative mRNA interferase YoeB n=1 Tax=Flavobacterium fructosi TaxID=3230416 RepID=A0ABW6HI48_9FLAO